MNDVNGATFTSGTIDCIVLKRNKHIQLSTKKKEYGFSTKGPFKGLRVKWQPKQNQVIASMRQTFITVCVEKKRKKTRPAGERLGNPRSSFSETPLAFES